MNSGFRNLLGWKDTTRFKAYLIAVAVQMIFLPPMIYFNMIQANVPLFFPVASALGGLLFGLAMNWGGGCAGGVLYKAGSGNIGAFVTVILVILGYVAGEVGILKPFRLLVQSIQVPQSAPVHSSPVLLVLAITGALVLTYLLWSTKAEGSPKWSMRRTGLVVGVISICSWVLSSLSGRPYGMAVLPGEKQAFDFVSLAAKPGWDLFFVIGIPVGGYVSSARKNEFKWTNISGSSIWRLAGGGFAMGTAASIAGGCTVGHSLTGVPLLTYQSLIFTASAIAGAVSSAYLNLRPQGTK